MRCDDVNAPLWCHNVTCECISIAED